jgi:iron complex transport system substrate-binding protein
MTIRTTARRDGAQGLPEAARTFRLWVLLGLALLQGLLGVCGTLPALAQTPPQKEGANQERPSAPEDPKTPEKALRFVDDAGRTCLLAAPATRIVSLYAGHSENLVALGAAERLVAVSRADDPALFPDLPRLPAKIDAERILALAPDLVLLRPLVESLSPGALATLERAGVTVVSLAPPEWESMPTYLERLGLLVGLPDGSAAWRKALEELALVSTEAARRRGAASPVRVFLESTSRELHTCAPRSWAAHLLAVAGGENVATDLAPLREGSALAACGVERLLDYAARGLDVYLVQRGPMNDTTEEEVRARPWASGLGNARIATIPEELVSRPSLLRVTEGAKALLDLFYPRNF